MLKLVLGSKPVFLQIFVLRQKLLFDGVILPDYHSFSLTANMAKNRKNRNKILSLMLECFKLKVWFILQLSYTINLSTGLVNKNHLSVTCSKTCAHLKL